MQPSFASSKSDRWRRTGGALAGLAVAALALMATPAYAAKDEGCEGGGFVISGLLDGRQLSTDGTFTIPAANLGSSFQVLGKYNEFTVVSSTLGAENVAFTGAANTGDLTGGRRTVVYSEKRPDHRGLTLNSAVTIELKEDGVEIARSGTGLRMKITAKDCAQGGIFQMEPQRNDRATTRFTHVLANGMFYYDNPNFRAREGDFVPYKDTTVQVAAA